MNNKTWKPKAYQNTNVRLWFDTLIKRTIIQKVLEKWNYFELI